MNFQVITLFPDLILQNFAVGVVGQAKEKGLIQLNAINPRQFTKDIHKTVDDRPYGGGDGMIMLAEVLAKSVESIPLEKRGKIIYMSPQGQPLTDKIVRQLAEEENLTLICGRYGGVDQRFLNQYVDQEISIGDYVLSGGELAAAVVIDSVSRMLPGVLGHGASKDLDSFSDGILECPNLTRPSQWQEQEVPAILLSGDHQKISQWRAMLAKLVTLQKRPDLLVGKMSIADRAELKSFFLELTTEERQVFALDDWEFPS